MSEGGYAQLLPGDPAPWFRQKTLSNPNYAFDVAAGRYILLGFVGSAATPEGQAVLGVLQSARHLFDDAKLCFFGVTADREDTQQGRVRDEMPGVRFFIDDDLVIARLYGAAPRTTEVGASGVTYRPFLILLDPTLRVMGLFVAPRTQEDMQRLVERLAGLPPVGAHAGFEVPTPILVVPNVFEPEFCRHLIALYEQNGGTESGFMREINGKTVAVHDHAHKRRKDYVIEDQTLIRATQQRIMRRVVPEIAKVHQFHCTRMERYIVSCYAAEDGGHFRAHRDNTTRGTAHRRFAVSINLNDEFEGGEVSFPEYGPRSFKAPPGGAVIFSCSLLHAVSRVTAGRRYAFLPFLYDEAAAELRKRNLAFVESAQGQGRMSETA